MFTSRDAVSAVKMLDGVERRTLVHGERTLLAEFALKKGFAIPLHSHPHEQTGYLVSGHLRFTVGQETIDTRPGAGWSVPGGVEHGVEILEDSIVVEVFSPVREDYLPAKQ
jgi:quercetin dioxygenase-like cupin family protein